MIATIIIEPANERTSTTVFQVVRGHDIEHIALLDSHVTLCGVGREHTANFQKGIHAHDCVVCRDAWDRRDAWNGGKS